MREQTKSIAMNYDCIALKLKDISVLIEKFYSQRIKELGLPILKNHMALFYILSGSDTSLAFTEIYNKWEISKSSLSEVISKYHKMGFVEKVFSADDKRSFTVSLTQKGKELHTVLTELEEELLSKFYLNFSTDQRAAFAKDIDRVIGNLANG